MTTIKNRFLGTFDPDNIELSKRVFLLVTKQSHVPPETVKNLKNGVRFLEQIKEIEAQIKELEKHHDPDSFEVHTSNARLDIWKTIAQMRQNNQVHFIVTRNKTLQEELLELYAQTDEYLNKKTYLPAMETDYMQKKFGDCVQMSVHTWTTNILGEYLVALPKEQFVKQEALKRTQSDLECLIEEKKKRLQAAESIGKQHNELKIYLQRLHTERQNLTASALQQELAKALQHIKESIARQKNLLNYIIDSVNTKRNELIQTIKEIEDSNNQIQAKEKLINVLQEDVKKLKEGARPPEELFRDDCFWGKQEAEKYCSAAALNKAQRKLNYDPAYFQPPDEEFDTEKFAGETGGVAIIKRGYRLVPADLTMRNQFFQSGEADGYIAKVKGLRYKIGIGVAKDENTIGYPYILTWLGDGTIPWMSITFSIPNCEYNYATIQNLESDISLLERESIYLREQIEGAEGVTGLEYKKFCLKGFISVQKKQVKEIERRIEDLEENYAHEIADHLARNQYILENYNREREELEDTSLLDSQIQTAGSEISAQTMQLENLNKKLRNLAIVITTQWESAKLLKEFSDLVVSSSDEKTRKEIITSCQHFIKVFNENKDLPQEIQAKYGFKAS